MKKYVSLILVLIMVIGCISCSKPESLDTENKTSENESSTVNNEATVPETSWEQLEKRNLGGRDFVLLDVNSYPEKHFNIPGSEMTGEIVNDALFKRDLDVQSACNVNIEYVQNPDNSLIRNNVAAGSHEYDLIIAIAAGDGLGQMAIEGNLLNLCENEHLTLDALWWSPLLYENMRLNDKMYFTTGDISPTLYGAAACLYLNLNLMDEYNVDVDIYDMVLDGRWTMDSFYTIIDGFDRDLNADGKMSTKDDLYGFACALNNLAPSIFYTGMEVELISISEDNKSLTCDGLTSDKTINAFESMMRFMQPRKYETNFLPVWKEGRVLFGALTTEFAITFREMEDDFLILPIPKWNEQQENYRTLISGWSTAFCAIDILADADFSGYMAEALARYSREFLRPTTYETFYDQKLSRDTRTGDVLNILLDSAYIDYCQLLNFAGINDKVMNIFFSKQPIVSTLESVRASLEFEITEFAKKW